MQYRPEIDGLRAVAIIPVVLFHAGMPLFQGGYVGVDVFFVISGFLITSIILQEQGRGNFSILSFYQRRIRRILPALFTVMAVTAVAAWFILLPQAMTALSRSILSVMSFTSNIHFYRKSDYFDVAAELNPLLHTWSLAVEEQFYIVFPFLMLLLARFGRNRRFAAILGLGLLSFGASEWMVRTNPSAGFYLLLYRAWELAIGALAALWLFEHPGKTGRNLPSLLGIGLIFLPIFMYSKQTPFPGVYALVPTVGTALILLYAGPRTLVWRVLAQPLLVQIGLISFSLYLWHQPLFAFANYHFSTPPSATLMASLIALAVVLSLLTYRFIETPFRQRGVLSFRRVATILSLIFAALATFGIAGKNTDGFAARFEPPALLSDDSFAFPHRKDGWCFYSVNSKPDLSIGEQALDCTLGQDSAGRRALLFGDSFAGQYEPLWDSIGKDLALTIQTVTTNWCFPTLTNSFPGPANGRAEQQCAINRAFLARHASEFDVVILGGQWTSVDANGWLPELGALLSQLSQNDGQLQIIMPSPPQTYPQLVEAALNGVGQKLEGISPRDRQARAANARLAQIASAHPNAMMIPRADLFRDGQGPSSYDVDGLPFSLDGAHVSIYGAKMAAQVFRNSPGFAELKQALETQTRSETSH